MTYIRVLIALAIVAGLLGGSALVAQANPLDSLVVSGNCDSTAHTVTINVHSIDTPRDITIVGQVLVDSTWQDSGSEVSLDVPVGTTQLTTSVTIPFPSNATAYRVRVVNSTLDNASGVVSNVVGCAPPTTTPTNTPTSTPTKTAVPPTSSSTPTATRTASASPTLTALATAVFVVATATNTPQATATQPAPSGGQATTSSSGGAQKPGPVCVYNTATGMWGVRNTHFGDTLAPGERWEVNGICVQDTPTPAPTTRTVALIAQPAAPPATATATATPPTATAAPAPTEVPPSANTAPPAAPQPCWQTDDETGNYVFVLLVDENGVPIPDENGGWQYVPVPCGAPLPTPTPQPTVPRPPVQIPLG